jgi:tetratricopeptide (TPR) repeat protein
MILPNPSLTLRRLRSSFSSRSYGSVLEALFVLVIVVLTGINIFVFIYKQQHPIITQSVLGTETAVDDSTETITFWKSFIEKHPSYREGYMELSRLYSTEGDMKEAIHYYQLAKVLDPNNMFVQELGKTLGL